MTKSDSQTAREIFQSSLNAYAPGDKLIVDGILGPRTEAKAKLISGQSYNVSNVDNDVKAVFAYPTVISVVTIQDKFNALQGSKLIDRSLSWNMFELALHIENKVVGDFVDVNYEGKYRGLFQFDVTTWSSVMGLSTWMDGKSSTSLQLQAMGKLLIANRDYHRVSDSNVAFTPEVAYLYHNQGASSAESFLLSGTLRYPKQSDKAIGVFDLAYNTAGQSGTKTLSSSSVIAFLQGRGDAANDIKTATDKVKGNHYDQDDA